MRTCFVLIAAYSILLCGCHPQMDSKEGHIAHKGEVAQLAHKSLTEIPVAVASSDCQAITAAAEDSKDAALREFLSNGRAFPVPAGTRVRVISESNGDRQIRIEDGAHAGKTGWVPLEWLRHPVREQ